MENPVIRKPLSRVRQVTEIPGESRTDTQFGNETDVNKIVARFRRTGELPNSNVAGTGEYCDVTNLQGDLTEIIEKGREALEEINAIKANQAKLSKEQEAENAKLADEYRQLRKQQEAALAPEPDAD